MVVNKSDMPSSCKDRGACVPILAGPPSKACIDVASQKGLARIKTNQSHGTSIEFIIRRNQEFIHEDP